MSIYDLVQVSLANLDQVLADLTDLADLLQHTHKKKIMFRVGPLVSRLVGCANISGFSNAPLSSPRKKFEIQKLEIQLV